MFCAISFTMIAYNFLWPEISLDETYNWHSFITTCLKYKYVCVYYLYAFQPWRCFPRHIVEYWTCGSLRLGASGQSWLVASRTLLEIGVIISWPLVYQALSPLLRHGMMCIWHDYSLGDIFAVFIVYTTIALKSVHIKTSCCPFWFPNSWSNDIDQDDCWNHARWK